MNKELNHRHQKEMNEEKVKESVSKLYSVHSDWLELSGIVAAWMLWMQGWQSGVC